MKWNRYIPYVWTWPFDVVIWLVWLLLCSLWGENLRWEEGCLVFNWRSGSWPARTWYRPWGGTTLGHAIFYNWYVKTEPDVENFEPIQVHEHVHVEQYEAWMLASCVIGLVVQLTVGLAHGQWVTGSVLGGIIWFLGYAWMGVGGYLTAIVRGEDAYRGSQHEEAAYAIEETSRH